MTDKFTHLISDISLDLDGARVERAGAAISDEGLIWLGPAATLPAGAIARLGHVRIAALGATLPARVCREETAHGVREGVIVDWRAHADHRRRLAAAILASGVQLRDEAREGARIDVRNEPEFPMVVAVRPTPGDFTAARSWTAAAVENLSHDGALLACPSHLLARPGDAFELVFELRGADRQSLLPLAYVSRVFDRSHPDNGLPIRELGLTLEWLDGEQRDAYASTLARGLARLKA